MQDPQPGSLFKSACERCSKAKTKCSGGNPCSTCDKKGMQCFYAFKKKRGPKPGQTKPTPKKSKPNFMSTYEKRVWSVFFTLFKNLKKTAKDNKFSWQWFVVQICRLDTYVRKSKSVKGRRLKEVLEKFYKKLEINIEKICDGVDGCPIPPHLCSYCASSIFPEQQNQHSHIEGTSVPGITQLPGSVSLINGKRNLWLQWKTSSFDMKFENNQAPCLVYEATDDSFGVFVNDKFVHAFGYNSASLTKLLLWSGGGFLPWAGDIFAALLVKEQDLLMYLKVMALKYQALRNKKEKGGLEDWKFEKLVDEDHEESILPFYDTFLCWVNKKNLPTTGSHDLDDVVENLEPTNVQFTSTIRIKKQISKHRVFLRCEIMCLSDVVPDTVPSPSNLPERVSHDYPLVDVDDTGLVASEMNKEFWPPIDLSMDQLFADMETPQPEPSGPVLPFTTETEAKENWNMFNKKEFPLAFTDDETWLQDLTEWVEG